MDKKKSKNTRIKDEVIFMSLIKIQKYCQYKNCGANLGMVYSATRYCHEHRKEIRKENDKKYHKSPPGQQGGGHGRWGPSAK